MLQKPTGPPPCSSTTLWSGVPGSCVQSSKILPVPSTIQTLPLPTAYPTLLPYKHNVGMLLKARRGPRGPQTLQRGRAGGCTRWVNVLCGGSRRSPGGSPHISTLLLTQVQLLHTLHENGGMVPLGDQLFVTGGHWKGMDGDYRVEMEVYDCAKDLWTREGSLPCLWLFHSSSSIFLDTSKWTEAFQGAHG